ncbi:uncharacterized protein LOC135339015 isoform X3 [Halichondria panicea]|uniref:uncharacterized protein LOC135339015 isoform X3 n=1 Tax=Halichondria panicea TaxID=6063 RepID=UPI00312B62A6
MHTCTAQQFAIEPESVVQSEGLLAEFECLSPGILAHAWFVNGIASTSLTSEIRVVAGSEGRPSVLTIPASSQYNNSVLQCAAISVSGGVFSRNATLIVERVSIEVVNSPTNIAVTVTNNFTMKTLTFRVHISLTTLGTNEMVALPPLNGGQNQARFNYRQPDNHTICDIFTFTVIPFSESGIEGRSSEPVTGFFTTVSGGNVTPLISQGENVLRKIVYIGGMVPNCTSFTSYQVISEILSAPIRKTIEDPLMINFSLPTDQRTNICVTLTSIMGVHLIFQNIPIITTDIQDLIVNVCPQENCVSVSIVYVEHTLSPGAMVCVIRLLSDVSLDFTSIKIETIRRNTNNNFTIPVARSGLYRVIAFDLENNNNIHVPRIPISIAADSETTFVSNKSSTEPNSPPNSEDITVTRLPNGSAEVTCTISDQSNCLVLVLSTKSPTSLDPMVVIGFIEPPNDRTTVTLNATSDVYVVVYTWNSDSDETIFDGQVSFISRLEQPTSPPLSLSPPVPMQNLIVLTIAGIITVVVVLLLLVVTVTIVVAMVIVKRKQSCSTCRGEIINKNGHVTSSMHADEVPESDGRVDWSSTFAGIEQPNEAYATVLMKNIAYEQIKKPRGQRIDDSQAPVAAEGEYESIEPVHQYEEVLPQGKASRANYVDIN